jgi:PIN domain nuclease of toxin-antitoxin system
VRVLLDTKVWLWMRAAPERLRPRTRRLLEDQGTELLFSTASAWEIAIKWASDKLQLPEPPAECVTARLAEDDIRVLPVELAHALRVSSLPHHHRDPFDRLLVAQALIEDLRLLTADPQLARYGVRVLKA